MGQNTTATKEQMDAIELVVRIAAISKIASKELGLETLSSRHNPDLDYHKLAVWQIRKALDQAYEAGCKRNNK